VPNWPSTAVTCRTCTVAVGHDRLLWQYDCCI
jgi:hypothetical protein